MTDEEKKEKYELKFTNRFKKHLKLVEKRNPKNIKKSEVKKQGTGNGLRRNQDHQNYAGKPKLLKRKFKSGETISNQCTN